MMANEISQEETKSNTQTREQAKQQMREEREKRKLAGKAWVRIRLIPIWLRILIVAALVALSLAAGLMVGYGVIGDGNAKEVFQKSTWTHIADLVTGKK